MYSTPDRVIMNKIFSLAIVIEGSRVTGPLKNILQFCEDVQNHQFSEGYKIAPEIITFFRGKKGKTNDFIIEVARRNIPFTVIYEQNISRFSLVKKMRAVLGYCKPALIQTHGVKSHFVVALAKDGSLPWIAFHHGYSYTDFKMRVYNQFDRYSLRRASYVVTVCEKFRNDLVSTRGVAAEKISVVMNSVSSKFLCTISTSSCAAVRAKLNISDSTTMVLSVGRLSSEKGHKDLIHAWNYVVLQLQTPASLVILGEGPELRRLKAQVVRSGLESSVIFGGHWKDDIASALASAALLVLPSHSEGCPNILLEAMLVKTPIVATLVGGVPEILVDGKTALLVPAKKPQELARAMLEALGDPKKTEIFCNAALEIVGSSFSAQYRLGRLCYLYDLVIREKNPRKKS
jgi:glycosyltransferase involved in cell wall biosynthesis